MRGEESPVKWLVRALLLPLGLAGCASNCAQQAPLPDVPPALRGTAPEQAVTLLPLSGPLQSENAELSGLAWYGEHLVMLPQYPGWEKDGTPCLYTVSKADILARLEHTAAGPLTPRCILFDSGGLEKTHPRFEGYEAIGILAGDQAYLTVETHRSTGKGFLVTGRIAPDLSVLKLEASPRAELIPCQTDVPNAGFETMVVGEDRVWPCTRPTGPASTRRPAAESFNRSLGPSGRLPLPAIEYRITDATSLDAAGRFWVMNYNYPGTSDDFQAGAGSLHGAVRHRTDPRPEPSGGAAHRAPGDSPRASCSPIGHPSAPAHRGTCTELGGAGAAGRPGLSARDRQVSRRPCSASCPGQVMAPDTGGRPMRALLRCPPPARTAADRLGGRVPGRPRPDLCHHRRGALGDARPWGHRPHPRAAHAVHGEVGHWPKWHPGGAHHRARRAGCPGQPAHHPRRGRHHALPAQLLERGARHHQDRRLEHSRRTPCPRTSSSRACTCAAPEAPSPAATARPATTPTRRASSSRRASTSSSAAASSRTTATGCSSPTAPRTCSSRATPSMATATSGSIYEHNAYTEALGIVYQFNHFGPLCASCLGNNLKDRSAGTVVRYNWIEGGNRQLDLVESDSATYRADPVVSAHVRLRQRAVEPDGRATGRSSTSVGTTGTHDLSRHALSLEQHRCLHSHGPHHAGAPVQRCPDRPMPPATGCSSPRRAATSSSRPARAPCVTGGTGSSRATCPPSAPSPARWWTRAAR